MMWKRPAPWEGGADEADPRKKARVDAESNQAWDGWGGSAWSGSTWSGSSSSTSSPSQWASPPAEAWSGTGVAASQQWSGGNSGCGSNAPGMNMNGGYGMGPSAGGCGMAGACGGYNVQGYGASAQSGYGGYDLTAAACTGYGVGAEEMMMSQMLQLQAQQQMLMAQSQLTAESSLASPLTAPMKDGDLIRFMGRIKGFYEGAIGGGYGFIECPEAKMKFGRDVYIHARQMTGFKVGDEISFTIVKNQKGEPQARNVMKAEDAIILRAKQQARQMQQENQMRAKQQSLVRETPVTFGLMDEEAAKKFQESLKKNKR